MGTDKNIKDGSSETSINKTSSGCLKPFIIILLMFIPALTITFFPLLNEFYENTVELLRPYSCIQFEKINSSRTNLEIALPKGYPADLDGLNTVVAYDSGSIYIYDSLALNNLINTIRINGKIENLSSYVMPNSKSMSYLKYTDLSSQVSTVNGFFIECLYKTNTGKRLCIYNIDSMPYQIYSWIQSHCIDKIDDNKKNTELLAQLKHEFCSLAPNIDSIDDVKHPGLTATLVLDIVFDEMEFVCFAPMGHFVAKDNKDNSLKLYNFKGKLINSCLIGHPFLCGYAYGMENTELYAFDGKYFYYFDSSQGELRSDKKIELQGAEWTENSKFIPINSDCFPSDFEILLENNRKLYKFRGDGENLGIAPIQLNNGESIIFYNFMYKNGNYYYFDHGLPKEKQINFKPLKICNLFWDINTNFQGGSIGVFFSGLFLDLGIDLSKNKPCIIFDVMDSLYLCHTSGIDEPVTEGYISYESNMMSIYFMNNKSIYKCSVKPYTLKLRKLDLEPEPIDSVKTN